MSVYKPKDSRIWLYDFQHKGQRFHGSTGQTSRRAAEQVERARRLDAATGAHASIGEMTLDAAAGRWWQEKGQGRGDAVDVQRRLTALITLIGRDVTLKAINQATVADAIEKRRRIGLRRAADRKARVYFPSNATVNRDVIETLRPILRRAKSHWTPKEAAHGLPEIDWTELRLTEPRAQSRTYSDTERKNWLAACDPDVRLALDMLLTYGLRFGELFFPLSALRLDDEATLTLQKGRKRDVLLEVPLTREHARELAARLTRAKAAKLDQAWFRQNGRDRLGNEMLEPITYAGMEYALSKAADVAKIPGERRIHGARHHAASSILRRTRNIKHVQGLLGHATIQSSQRYAHVLTDEIRQALDGTDGKHDFGTISGERAGIDQIEPDLFRSGDEPETGKKAGNAGK